MNVAGAVLDRLIEDKIYETDDRCRVCFCCHHSLAVCFAQLQRFPGFAELLQHFLHARRIGAVMLLDQLFDLLRRRHDDLDVFAQRETQILCHVRIERIDQRHSERRFTHVNRQRAVQPSQSAGNET